MKHCAAALLFLFLFIPVASANSSMFDIMDEKFYDGDWQIADKHGTPNKTAEREGYIHGWIDITGFDQMSIVDRADYVNGAASDFAIVEDEAWYSHVPGVVTSFTSNVSVHDIDGATIASQSNLLAYDMEICWTNDDGSEECRIVSCTESAVFSSQVHSPGTYDNTIVSGTIYVTEYANPYTPNTRIWVAAPKNVVKTVFAYKEHKLTRYDRIGWVDENHKGTEHIEFIDEVYWHGGNDVLNVVDKEVVIYAAPIDLSELTVRMYTPYTVKTINDYNITRIEYDNPLAFFSPILLLFVGTVAIFVAGIWCIWRKVQQ